MLISYLKAILLGFQISTSTSQLGYEWLLIKSFSCCFVQCICQSPLHRRKWRLSKSCRIYAVIDKMYVNFLWSFLMTNKPVGIKIVLLRSTFFKCYLAIERMPNIIISYTFYHI